MYSFSLNSHLNALGTKLSSAIERLSSGLRINSAKDDAAGLAISELLKSKLNGINQAKRNTNDAISMTQVTDGALASINQNLQRIRELSIQAINSVNSTTDRASIQTEVSNLVEEINRIASSTEFNGIKLIDGSFSEKTMQIGAGQNETITIDKIESFKSNNLGKQYQAALAGSTTSLIPMLDGELSINGIFIQHPVNGGGNYGQYLTSAYSIAEAINSSQSEVYAEATENSYTGSAPILLGSVPADQFKINFIDIGAISAGLNAVEKGTNVAAAINLQTTLTGVTASTNSTTGAVTLRNQEGGNITISGITTGTGLSASLNRSTVTLRTSSPDGITISGTNPSRAGFSAGYTAATATGMALSEISVLTADSATLALNSIDSSLDIINFQRATLGATINRLASVIDNLSISDQSARSTYSKLVDSDYGIEISSLTRIQILQNATLAMISQANQSHKQILQLLE